MPASVRIIRVIDDTYTVETEVEADDVKTLMHELQGSDWGRRIATVLEDMLPKVKERLTIRQARERLTNDWQTEIEKKIIAKIDVGEDTANEEILIVWLNAPLEMPKVIEGYKIEMKKTPSYVEPPPPPDTRDYTEP